MYHQQHSASTETDILLFVHDDTHGEEETPLLPGKSSNLGQTNDEQSAFHSHSYSSYPRAVYFVLSSKFFESFAANGVRSILALYLRDSLHYTEDFSTAILHVYNFFGQFCPIIGAVLADSYIGNVSTIFRFMFLYAVGWIGLVFVALVDVDAWVFLPLLFATLLLLGIGNGSIRACISALGGSQFVLPNQSAALQRYFSHYYFIYYVGILLSKFVPQSVRSSTRCLGNADCYPAVFGMLAMLFVSCWVLFLFGMPFYRPEHSFSKENILNKVIGCVWLGFRRRRQSTALGRRRWIDAAIGPYSAEFVDDVWDYLRVVVLFLPLPIYFALLVQQDSTWTFQATQLNCVLLSNADYRLTIQADQAKAIGPIIMLVMIPVWQNVCVPMLKRHAHIEMTPLRSIALGGFCAATSFVCAAILQVCIEHDLLDRRQSAMGAAFELASANRTGFVPGDAGPIGAAAPVSLHRTDISIAWQIPQFFLLMMGEVLLSIPGLQFAFNEAPVSMKSVLAATWFLNNAIGNLIVVVVAELHWFVRPSAAFVAYAMLMLVSMLVFMAIASTYEYRADRRPLAMYADKPAPTEFGVGKCDRKKSESC